MRTEVNVEYSFQEIRKMADVRMRRLRNNKCVVGSLPDYASLYHGAKEVRDSYAIRNADPESRLFKEFPEDIGC
jgi:hypothetical protein